MPGDGIGTEVISAGVEVLKAIASTQGFELTFEHFDWSSETYKKTGKYIPDGGLDELKKHNAILFGSVGAPGKSSIYLIFFHVLTWSTDVPDHISLWGLRLAICQPLQQYANVRPTKVFRGTSSPLRNCAPGDLDWVIIRENSEGEYAGQGGRSHRGTAWETATEVSIFTRHCVERIMRFAFETARLRKKLLTVVTKSNAQRNGMVMWDEVAAEVGKDFPDVKVDKMLVDAMTVRMVNKPASLDTIVATNLVCDQILLYTYPSTNLCSTPISCPISRLRSQDPLVSLRHRIWIRRERIRPCSSQSTARLSISRVKALLIRLVLFGRHPRCYDGWVRKLPLKNCWQRSKTFARRELAQPI